VEIIDLDAGAYPLTRSQKTLLGRRAPTGPNSGALYVKCREKAEREASPTARVIDSQSVKSAEKGAQC